MAKPLAPRSNLNTGIAALYMKLHEYRSAIASFAVLDGSALIFLWVSWGTQFHQLAIGLITSAIVLTLALAVFELCWEIGMRPAPPPGSQKKKN
jgi:hypothetical protein